MEMMDANITPGQVSNLMMMRQFFHLFSQVFSMDHSLKAQSNPIWQCSMK